MRVLLSVALTCLLAGGGLAQRGGGHGVGMGGGGFHSGGGMGGIHGWGWGGHGGFDKGFGRHDGFRGFGYTSGYSPGYWPDYGDGGNSSSDCYDDGYISTSSCSYSANPYYEGYDYRGYASPPPNVTVVYPPEQPAVPYGDSQQPVPAVTQGYDQYGQEIERDRGAPPIYVLAFKDHVIRAATSYSIRGKTLDYVTYEQEQKHAPLDSLDLDLTMRLNRERE